jgi:hypothetical protein
MANHTLSVGVGVGGWTPYAKQIIARSMYEKGKAFLGAALLLRQRGAYEYVVLHLLCQGIELLGKGYLLSVNYDEYKPRLRAYGHNLLKLVTAVEKEAKVGVLRPAVRAELETLNNLYKQHLLRYGSGYDILVDSKTIPSRRVLSRSAALLRLAQKHRLLSEPQAI